MDINYIKTVLLKTVREAGIAVLAQTSKATHVKQNQDIVTQADLVANEIIKNRLNDISPDFGWLSEESKDDATRYNKKCVWVVDPIDGTREYALNIPEYAISVALVVDYKPILACVHNPATNELFHAQSGQGAWLNDKPIQCRHDTSKRLTLLASRSEFNRGEWHYFEKQHHVTVIGSIAYKLALLAAGFADATFSLGPKHEWDIAAGTLLVQEAGGIVTDKSNHTIFFNQENIKVNGIIARTPKSDAVLIDLIHSATSPLKDQAPGLSSELTVK